MPFLWGEDYFHVAPLFWSWEDDWLFLPLAYVIGPLLGFGLLGVWVWQGITRAAQAGAFLQEVTAGQR